MNPRGRNAGGQWCERSRQKLPLGFLLLLGLQNREEFSQTSCDGSDAQVPALLWLPLFISALLNKKCWMGHGIGKWRRPQAA